MASSSQIENTNMKLGDTSAEISQTEHISKIAAMNLV